MHCGRMMELEMTSENVYSRYSYSRCDGWRVKGYVTCSVSTQFLKVLECPDLIFFFTFDIDFRISYICILYMCFICMESFKQLCLEMSPTLEIICLWVKLYMSEHLNMLLRHSLAYKENLFLPLQIFLNGIRFQNYHISLPKNNTCVSYFACRSSLKTGAKFK